MNLSQKKIKVSKNYVFLVILVNIMIQQFVICENYVIKWSNITPTNNLKLNKTTAQIR